MQFSSGLGSWKHSKGEMQLDPEGEDLLQLLLGEQGNCLWLLICFLASAQLP